MGLLGQLLTWRQLEAPLDAEGRENVHPCSYEKLSDLRDYLQVGDLMFTTDFKRWEAGRQGRGKA